MAVMFLLPWLLKSTLVYSTTFDVGAQYSCAILPDQTVTCDGWGDKEIPKDMTFTQISAGYYHSCGITTDQHIFCWVNWGKNALFKNHYPSPPEGFFSQVSTGGYHACGIRADRSVACWGNNDYSQAIPPRGTFSQVSTGRWHTCGLQSEGSITCWGLNREGQASPPAGTFLQVATAMGGWHSCGIRTDHTLVCWGANEEGQTASPEGKFLQVALGQWYTCGLQMDHTVTCWGNNSDGQAEPPPGTFRSIDAGLFHTCGVRTNHTVDCWGNNVYGTLGLTGTLVKVDDSSESENECFFYGVVNEGQFFTLDADTYEFSLLGKATKNTNLLALDSHPVTNELYAAVSHSGNRNPHLERINRADLSYTDLGEIGFKSIKSLAFHPDGTLWGWSIDAGLFQIQKGKNSVPLLNKSKLIISNDDQVHIASLTWNKAGSILYGVENLYEGGDETLNFQGIRVWAYEANENTATLVCSDLMSSLETKVSVVERLPNDTLLFGFQKAEALTFDIIDLDRCKILTQIEIPGHYGDIKGIAATECVDAAK